MSFTNVETRSFFTPSFLSCDIPPSLMKQCSQPSEGFALCQFLRLPLQTSGDWDEHQLSVLRRNRMLRWWFFSIRNDRKTLIQELKNASKTNHRNPPPKTPMEKLSVYLPFSEVTDSWNEMTFSSEEVGMKRLLLRRKDLCQPTPSSTFSSALFSRNVWPRVFKQVVKNRGIHNKAQRPTSQ